MKLCKECDDAWCIVDEGEFLYESQEVQLVFEVEVKTHPTDRLKHCGFSVGCLCGFPEHIYTFFGHHPIVRQKLEYHLRPTNWIIRDCCNLGRDGLTFGQAQDACQLSWLGRRSRGFGVHGGSRLYVLAPTTSPPNKNERSRSHSKCSRNDPSSCGFFFGPPFEWPLRYTRGRACVFPNSSICSTSAQR